MRSELLATRNLSSCLCHQRGEVDGGHPLEVCLFGGVLRSSNIKSISVKVHSNGVFFLLKHYLNWKTGLLAPEPDILLSYIILMLS